MTEAACESVFQTMSTSSMEDYWGIGPGLDKEYARDEESGFGVPPVVEPAVNVGPALPVISAAHKQTAAGDTPAIPKGTSNRSKGTSLSKLRIGGSGFCF